jgi:hypothetical protein
MKMSIDSEEKVAKVLVKEVKTFKSELKSAEERIRKER